MASHDQPIAHESHSGCCGCTACGAGDGVSRREFLQGGAIALGGVAMTGLTWSALSAAESDPPRAAVRVPLVVRPILTYSTPRRRPQTSWRNWGGIETQDDAEKELARIRGELGKLASAADYPVKFLDPAPVRNAKELAPLVAEADAVVIYAAGGSSAVFDAAIEAGKDVIFFLRHRSGPVSLWYEIISPRYLHRHTDTLAVQGADNQDVVVDSADELSWRLRALCGLKNTRGTRILAVGGPAGWGPGGRKAPELTREKWKFDIRTVSYRDLGKLLTEAMADAKAVRAADERATAYLDDKTVRLETKKDFVRNAFLLERVFRGLLAQADARALTINSCMGTIMPLAKTTACLTLSLLNDAGYLAFCESDFVVIPSGVLLSNISGKPPFLNDPTYPHAGVITLAHCTAPRRMNGKDLEPARILTHFESDYGAAPKVEMRKGQKVTNILCDFKMARWVGLAGEIADVPFLPICRSQIDVGYKVPDETVALNMPGFHWMTVYGDYLREAGYALKKTPIAFQCLG